MQLDYDVSAESYYRRAVGNLVAFQTHREARVLFYAAFELRNCIERILFEYLVLLQIPRERLEKFRNEYRVKDLERALRDAEPEWQTKIEFAAFYLSTLGVAMDIKVPNPSYLGRLYGQLGAYLHSLKNPDDTSEDQEWWKRFIHLLDECRIHLHELLSGGMAMMHLSDEGLVLYRGFRDNTIGREELGDRIRREVANGST